MKHLFLSAAMLLALASGASAELSKPIVAFTPVIAKNADALELTTEQRGELKAWLDTMPAKRKELEQRAIALRAKLRTAIIVGAPVADREALAAQVGQAETDLVMMRSNCTDHWRAILSETQFAKMLELAAAAN